MKKVLKRVVALSIICMIMLSFVVTAYARTGDIIGKACYTDIVARINGHDIASFNVDGYTYIVAEDLRNYGFSVIWHPDKRLLTVSRNPSISTVTSTYVKDPVPSNLVGVKSHDLLSTDIVTYVDNNYTPSFNINGLTIIKFDELARFGSMQWNANERKIELTMARLEQKAVSLENLRDINGNYPKLKFNVQNAYGTTFEKVIGGTFSSKWLLDNKYKKFTATIVPIISTDYVTNGMAFVVQVDGREIHRTSTFKSTKPFNVELDIAGCNMLEITNTNHNYLYNAVVK